MSTSNTPVPKPEVKGASRSFLIGSSAIVILFILAIILGVISVGSGIRHIKKYTSPEPISFTVETDQKHFSELAKHIDTAIVTAKNGQETSLQLNVKDLNTLLYQEASLAEFKKYSKVSNISEAGIVADISFPISKFKWASWTGVEDQFLNGSVLLKPRLKKELLYIDVAEVQKDGKQIMLDTFDSLKEHNFLYFWPNAVTYQEELKLIKSTELQDGNLIINFGPRSEDD